MAASLIRETEHNKINCIYAEQCSGCQLLHLPYQDQTKTKKELLQHLLSEFKIRFSGNIDFASAGTAFLRDRLDFSLEDGRLGLYHHTNKSIVDLPICAQLSPELQAWLSEFREIKWPVKKGSIRLRVGPQGKKGVWLDFANTDIKKLLDEKTTLQRLQEVALVEVGQRRKVLKWTGSEFKLRDPELQVWFQTWLEDQSVDLYCQVASFTQPSLKANKPICNIVGTWVKSFKDTRIIEFGSGIGNLTLPALNTCKSLLACEIDELALQGLEKTLQSLPAHLASLKDKITIHRGDFQKKLLQDFSQFDGVLANPPRSGLMDFLKPLEQLSSSQRPPFFIYMSCFPESMVKDLVRLQACDYELKELCIVDQFPQTKHYEVLGLLQRK